MLPPLWSTELTFALVWKRRAAGRDFLWQDVYPLEYVFQSLRSIQSGWLFKCASVPPASEVTGRWEKLFPYCFKDMPLLLRFFFSFQNYVLQLLQSGIMKVELHKYSVLVVPEFPQSLHLTPGQSFFFCTGWLIFPHSDTETIEIPPPLSPSLPAEATTCSTFTCRCILLPLF